MDARIRLVASQTTATLSLLVGQGTAATAHGFRGNE
jgi:hypothetical protein